jgi:hypothetical protein
MILLLFNLIYMYTLTRRQNYVFSMVKSPTSHIYIFIYIYIRERHLNMWRAGQTARPRRLKYQFVYLNVVIVSLDELDSLCLNGRAGEGKPSRR